MAERFDFPGRTETLLALESALALAGWSGIHELLSELRERHPSRCTDVDLAAAGVITVKPEGDWWVAQFRSSSLHAANAAAERLATSSAAATVGAPEGHRVAPLSPTVEMEVAGFESAAWDGLSDAVLQKKPVPEVTLRTERHMLPIPKPIGVGVFHGKRLVGVCSLDELRNAAAQAPAPAPEVPAGCVQVVMTFEQVQALYLTLMHGRRGGKEHPETRPAFGWMEQPLVEIEKTLEPVHSAIHDRQFNSLNRQFFGDDSRRLPEADLKTSVSPSPAGTHAARDVLAERQRQISAEGWTPEHDDGHDDGSLAIAAACYALASLQGVRPVQVHTSYLWEATGWAFDWFKPQGRRRNLVKAGALVLAEIERLDRASKPPAHGSEP